MPVINLCAVRGRRAVGLPVDSDQNFSVKIFLRRDSAVPPGRQFQEPTMWIQRKIQLPPYPRGFHLITQEIVSAVPELRSCQVGWLQAFLQHTSAALTINENADPDVRVDFETAMNHAVPESLPYVHTLEGADDMPAHVKASMLGAAVMIPIASGALQLGTWQGIYLCEHRNRGGRRSVVITIHGSQEVPNS